jgi:hypothetical protein
MRTALMRELGEQPQTRVAQIHPLQCRVTTSLLMAGVARRRTIRTATPPPLIETRKRGTMLYNPGPPFILGDIIFADFCNIHRKQRAFVLEALHPRYYLQLELRWKICTSTNTAFLAPMLMPCKQNDIVHDFDDLFTEAWREITLGSIPCGL